MKSLSGIVGAKPLPVEHVTFYDRNNDTRSLRRAFRGIVGVKRDNAKVKVR